MARDGHEASLWWCDVVDAVGGRCGLARGPIRKGRRTDGRDRVRLCRSGASSVALAGTLNLDEAEAGGSRRGLEEGGEAQRCVLISGIEGRVGGLGGGIWGCERDAALESPTEPALQVPVVALCCPPLEPGMHGTTQ